MDCCSNAFSSSFSCLFPEMIKCKAAEQQSASVFEICSTLLLMSFSPANVVSFTLKDFRGLEQKSSTLKISVPIQAVNPTNSYFVFKGLCSSIVIRKMVQTATIFSCCRYFRDKVSHTASPWLSIISSNMLHALHSTVLEHDFWVYFCIYFCPSLELLVW